jgi:hypothetical protein
VKAENVIKIKRVSRIPTPGEEWSQTVVVELGHFQTRDIALDYRVKLKLHQIDKATGRAFRAIM